MNLELWTPGLFKGITILLVLVGKTVKEEEVQRDNKGHVSLIVINVRQ